MLTSFVLCCFLHLNESSFGIHCFFCYVFTPHNTLYVLQEDETRRPWGVRGHSITSHADFHDDGDELAGPPQPVSAPNLSPAASAQALIIIPPGDENTGVVRVHSNTSSVGSAAPRKIPPQLAITPSSQAIKAWITRDSSPTKWLHSPTSASSVGSPVYVLSLIRNICLTYYSHLNKLCVIYFSRVNNFHRRRSASMQPESTREILTPSIASAGNCAGSLDSINVPIEVSRYTPLFKRQTMLKMSDHKSANSKVCCSSLFFVQVQHTL